ADVVCGNTVDQHLVGVAVSAANVEGRRAAGLTASRELESGNEAERVRNFGGVAKVVGCQDGDGRADLRYRRGRSGGGDGDLLGQRAGGKGEVDRGLGGGGGEDGLAGCRLKGTGFNADAVERRGCDMKQIVSGGAGRGCLKRARAA